MSMRDEFDRAADARAAAAEDKARLKKSSSLRQHAARFLCCGGASPTSEADSHVCHERAPADIEIQASKWWKVPRLGKRRHQGDVAAYTDASVCSQNGPLQADSCQGAAHTAFQGFMFGESRQAVPLAMADPVQSPVALPKQATHARAVSVTAYASSAHELQVQSLQQQHEVAGHSGCQDNKGELLEQHCSAGVEDDEQLVGGASPPEELQEHMVDAVLDR